MIRIAHTADWHIGRFPGPEKDGQNCRYLDLQDRLNAFTENMKEEKPDAIIVAGDVFHQARTWSDRGLDEVQTAIEYVRKLEQIAPVIVLRGTPNHDGEFHFRMLKTAFNGDEKVKIIDVPKVVHLHTDNGDLEIAGLPGFERGYFRANNPGLSKEQEDQAFSESVRSILFGLKAQCKTECPAILTGHYTITGADMNGGQTAFFSKFEPVVDTATLKAAGFDLACFGHLHNPQQVAGADNVFYAGALSQLNFNDEGQKRGYYIHEIDGGQVKSTFRELKGLRFKTIRMEDEDVERIINDGPEANEDVAGKIIRVIYNCTDEHNKAFNHALLEKVLLKKGAFWVQEIVPERITSTVDRRSLAVEDGPEENLLSYLKEKEVPEKEMAKVVELARPIIAKAMESTTQDKQAGLFVPIQMEVQNYRNYKNETFNFDGINFCTINGENGAGKSSLFMDAINDALFEEPREGELTGWISNDPEVKSGSIKFTFQLGDKIYRVTRTRTKKGRATLNLAEFTEDGWQNRGKEKYRDTQKAIVNLLGMDSLTLKACALIMQDQYGLFLQADKEARMNILGNILGLGLYDKMEEIAAEKTTESNRKVRLLNKEQETILAGLPDLEQLYQYMENVEQSREKADATYSQAKEECESAKAELNRIMSAMEEMVKLGEKIADYDRKIMDKEDDKSRYQAGLVEARYMFNKGQGLEEQKKEKEELEKREKELVKLQGEEITLEERRLEEIRMLESDRDKVGQEIQSLDELKGKIEPLRRIVATAESLEKAHEEYVKLQEKLEESEEYRPQWEEKQNKLAQMEKGWTTREHEYKEKLARLNAEKESITKRAELMEESNCPFIGKGEIGCIFFKDAVEAQGKLPELEQEIKEVSGLLTLQQGQFDDATKEILHDIIQIEKVFNFDENVKMRRRLRELESSEKQYREIDSRKRELELYREQEARQELGVIEMLEAIRGKEDSIKKIEQRLDEFGDIDGEIEIIGRRMDELDEILEMEKKIPMYKEKCEASERRIAEIDSEIAELKGESAEYETQRDAKRNEIKAYTEVDSRVKRLEAEADTSAKEVKYLDREIGATQAKIEQAEEGLRQAEQIKGKINEESQKAAGYECLKKAFSQDGIPHNIIRSIIPVLENAATNILGQMSGGKMSVEFITEKVLKSNAKKEVTTLDIVINDAETGRLPYKSRSGGEKVKAALSVILALSEVKQKRAGMQFGFLMIDEAPFLDANATQAYCDALEAIQNRYSDVKVMAITHDESFKARFPQSVTVYKDAGGSHVRVD